MKLMVIDGNSIVNRAFYGVSQNLSTREGLPTNATGSVRICPPGRACPPTPFSALSTSS